MSQFNKKPNLYTLLELKPGAKQQEIKYNYYKLIRQYHPDLSTDPVAHAKLLNEAYSILSNDKMREKYDKEHGFDNFDPTKNPEKNQRPEDYSKTD
jgi:curved DNA-binding protein CbpA